MARHYTLHAPHGTARIDFRAELNDQQYAAVTSDPGHSLVIAGAGSGKTRTLTYRVAWLLERGEPASSILLLTFTNKAAREMIERVSALLPEGAAGIWGGTFHSIGNRILRAHAEQAGFRPGFSIMDREDQEDMIESVVAREGLRAADRRFPKGAVLAEIFGLSANTARSVREVLGERYRYFIPMSEQIEGVHAHYEGRKRETNSLDFDDLLAKTLGLFSLCPEVLASYQKRFRHILVDEYQDTNRIQAELVDRLSGHHRSVMVVGDDAQSIYSWRGANFANILKFPERHEGAKVFRIETNYRSRPEILELANASIAANTGQFPKALRAVRDAGPTRPALVALPTNNQQAAFVAQRVMELNEEGIDLREMAVLYRAHYHSMEVQLEFTRRGIPFGVTSGLRFFEQAHIKDVAAFLKFAVNPRDEVAFKRMAKLLSGIGPKAAESIWSQTRTLLDGTLEFSRLHSVAKIPAKSLPEWKQLVHTLEELAPGGKPSSPSAMIESVLLALYDDYMKAKFTNYDARREDLLTLGSYAGQFESAEEFLSQLALLGNLETSETIHAADEDDRVTLTSVHQAKGLEWKVVFVIWLADGSFPSTRASDTPEGMEEERRLFYVAVTRCKDELYLTFPEFRANASYADAFQRPSPFLQELPEHLTETWDIDSAPAGETPF